MLVAFFVGYHQLVTEAKQITNRETGDRKPQPKASLKLREIRLTATKLKNCSRGLYLTFRVAEARKREGASLMNKIRTYTMVYNQNIIPGGRDLVPYLAPIKIYVTHRLVFLGFGNTPRIAEAFCNRNVSHRISTFRAIPYNPTNIEL